MVYDFIRRYRQENGFAPSYREIADGLGIGLTTVDHHILFLQREGKISYRPGTARSIVVL